MSFPSRRRFAAGCLALLASCVLAPGAAHAGTLTQIVCADPATTTGLTPDGQLPDGFDVPATRDDLDVAGSARCASGDPLHLPLRSVGSFDHGAALRFDAGVMAFRSARIWRAWNGHGNWAYMAGRQASWGDFGRQPQDEVCNGASDCGRRGDLDPEPFAAGNRLTIDRGTASTNGFHLSAICRGERGSACGTEADAGLRVAGGEIVLFEDTKPRAAADPAGPLTGSGTLAGTVGASLAGASDTGSGVYRLKVVADDIERAATVIDANDGRCADVRPGDQDPYQFAYRQPCRATVGAATVSLDTTKLPEGPTTIKLVLEDAAGNETLLSHRPFVVDNVPPPWMVSAPALSGPLRAGNQLALTPGVFDDFGLDGDPQVTRVWERCRYDGSDCVDVSSSASDRVYLLGDDDLNRRFRVREVAKNAEGTSEPAVSALTAVVTRADGTLPPGNDGVDNDDDGDVDEPGEAAPGPGGSGGGNEKPPTGGGSGGGGGSSSGGSSSGGSTGATGATGAAGAPGVTTVASSLLGPPNGQGASPQARLTVTSDRSKIRFGQTATVTGRLLDALGRPISGAVVELTQTPALAGAKAAASTPVVTGVDGSFVHRATGKPGSRRLTFAYSHVRGAAPVTAGSVTVTVAAQVTLSVRLKGIVASYRGKVLAGWMPKGGKLVIVQGRAKGGKWQTFASRRAGRTGTFKGSYRLKVRRPGKRLQFRVRVLSESGWNYGSATSKAVTRKVR